MRRNSMDIKVQEYNTGNIDKYSTKNKLKRAMVERFDKKILDLIGTLLEKEDLSSLLDAGCGEGIVANMISEKYPMLKVTGIDGAKEAVKYANSKYSNIEVLEDNIYDLSLDDNSFDIVICSEVIEHLNEYPIAIKELLRVAKSKIIITVPNEPWFCLGNLVSLHNVSRLGNPIDHVNHWTYPGFKRMINTQFKGVKGISFYRSFPWQIAVIDI